MLISKLINKGKSAKPKLKYTTSKIDLVFDKKIVARSSSQTSEKVA